MKQSGRASIITIAALIAVLAVVGLLAFSKESLASVGGRFMQALQRGDVDTLTDMSYLGDKSKDEMRKDWEFSVNTAGRYWYFSYRIIAARQFDAKAGSVTMQVARDVFRPGSYEEKFELPLVKVDDKWKVDVRALSSELYPALPGRVPTDSSDKSAP